MCFKASPLEEKRDIIIYIILKFKNIILKKPAQIEKWKALAEKAANDLIPDSELSEREKAQIIGFNFKSKALWMIKHLKYVLQASPLMYGYYYMKKLTFVAKKFAHDHMTENMEEAIRTGKYKANILEKTTSAYKNVMQIKSGSVYRCSYLMKLLN